MIQRLISLCLCLLWLSSADAVAEERWYSVRLDHQHIGYLLSSRNLEGNRLTSSSELRIQFNRNGERLQVMSNETSIESADGQPLGFSSYFETAGIRSRVEGRITDGTIRAEVEQAGQQRQVSQPWPRNALLAEGQRLHLQRFVQSAAKQTDFLAFDPTSMRALGVRSHRVADASQLFDSESTDMLRRQPLLEQDWVAVQQRLGREGASVETRMLLEQGSADPLAMRVPALGLQLEIIRCDRSCAMAEPTSTDVLARATVVSPRALNVGERLRPLRYQIEVDGGSGQALGNVPGQHLEGDLDRPQLLIDPEGSSASPPTARDLAATRWLQSDDPTLTELAATTTRGQTRDQPRMLLLERRVRELIQVKSLRIGYASAREALDLGEGDCTEHAVLLAALARAAGIPARVVTGLAYSARFGERRHVFVPHAWVIAWVDGSWRGYDAALPRFDATHIGLAMGDGDPFDFYAGLDLLGRLQISEISRPSRRQLKLARNAH